MKNTLKILLSVFAFSLATPVSASEEYYHQFPYAVEEMDDGDGEVMQQWRWLGAALHHVPLNPNRIVVVGVDFFLLENQQFVLAYDESFKVRDNPQSPWRFEMSPNGFCKTIRRGSWSASGTQLVTGQGFRLDRATFSGRASAKLILDEAILTPEVKGQEIVLDYGVSNVPMETWLYRGPFCPRE